MTEEGRHQATLHPEERRFRDLAESFAQAIWETDAAGLIVDRASSWPLLAGHASPTAASWQGSRILVVDDNVEAAEILGALLEMEGHTIRIVHDGVQAVGEAGQFNPDVIFMDVGMPVMDGLEATRRIRRLDLALRPFIIALTGWSSEASRGASAAAGCDLHLAKPADVEMVTRSIEASRRSRMALSA